MQNEHTETLQSLNQELEERVRQLTQDLRAAEERLRVIGIDMDITERKRGETARSQSPEQLRLMIEQAPVSIAMLDRNLCYLAASLQWKKDLGREDQDLSGRSHHEVFQDIPDWWKEVHQKALAGEIIKNDEDEWIQADGSKMWLRWAVHPWRDANGEIGGIIMSGENITPRKQMEEQLRERERRLQAIVENLTEGLIIADFDGHLGQWNRAALEMHGFRNLSEATLRVSEMEKIFELATLEGRTLSSAERPLARIIRGEKLRNYEVRIRRKGSDWERIFKYNGNSLVEPGGKTIAILTITDITDRKQAEKQLRLWADAFEHCAHGMVIGDPSTNRIWACNPAYARMQQMSVEEILNAPIMSMYAPSEQELLRKQIAEADRTGKTQFESVVTRKDGLRLPVQLDIVTVSDKAGNLLYRVATRQDISARKQAEESLRVEKERFEKLTMASPSAIYAFHLTADGIPSFGYSSPASYELYGFTPEELAQSNSLISARIRPEVAARLNHSLAESRRTMSVFHETYPYQHPQKGEIWIEVFAAPILETDGRVTWHSVANDVTERKQAEEKLRQSEAHFRALFEARAVGSVECDIRTGRFLRVNQKMCEITGYSAEELQQRTFTEITHPEDRHLIASQYQQFITGETSEYEIEKRYVRKDGTSVWVGVSSSLLLDQAGHPWHTVAVIQDITDRKKAEEEVRESEVRFRTLFEQSAVGKVIIEYDSKKVVDCNQTAAKDLGYTREEMLELTLVDFVVSHPSEEISLNHQTLAQGRDLKLQAQHRTKTGEIRDALVILTNIRIKGKDYVYSSVMDVTEQKRAEKELEKERVRLEKIASSSPSVIYSFCVTPEGNYSYPYVSAAFEELYGLRQEDVQRDARLTDAKVHPDDFPGLRQSIFDSARNLSRWHHAWRVNHPSKGETWVEGHSAPVRDADGSITWHGILNDVTEQIRAEQALRNSEERLKLALAAAQMGVWEWDLRTNAVFWSPECYEMLGSKYFDGTLAGFSKLLHPEDSHRVMQLVEQSIVDKVAYSAEFRAFRSDGQELWLSNLGRAVYDQQGAPTSMIGIAQDITKRKLAEAELERSLEQVRSLATHLQDVREEERKRIARELHDELGQALAGLKFDLAWLENNLLPKDAPPVQMLQEKTQTMSEVIDATIQIGRKIATELRPRVLDDLGLVAALRWQARDFQKRTGITCEFIAPDADITLDAGRATAAFRICQETLTNILRHAQATAVTILVQVKNNCLQLEVKDNGRGITKQEINQNVSHGLLGMKERLLPYGGKVAIHGRAGKGTTITVLLPLIT